MTTPLVESYVSLEALIPQDPKHDEVFKAPENQTLGSTHILLVLKNNTMIAHASQIAKVHNVPGKSCLTRVISQKSIKKNDILRVVYDRFDMTALQFVEFHGWEAHAYKERFDREYDSIFLVTKVIPVGPQKNGFHIYERIFLSAQSKEK